MIFILLARKTHDVVTRWQHGGVFSRERITHHSRVIWIEWVKEPGLSSASGADHVHPAVESDNLNPTMLPES
jgi:hypothetical protein